MHVAKIQKGRGTFSDASILDNDSVSRVLFSIAAASSFIYATYPPRPDEPPFSLIAQTSLVYMVLLPTRFALHVGLPQHRWSLTPPFHPYPKAVYFCGTFCEFFFQKIPQAFHLVWRPLQPGLSSSVATSDEVVITETKIIRFFQLCVFLKHESGCIDDFAQTFRRSFFR